MGDQPTSHVRYSGFITIPTAIALGSSITVGLGVYLLIGPIFELIGSVTPAAYLLTVPFFLPIILTLAERTAVIQGNGGLYNLSKGNNVFVNYLVGWLILGGYLFLGAMLAWGAGFYLQIGLETLFNISINPWVLSAILIFLVALYPLYGSVAHWGQRATLIYLTIAFLAFICVWAFLFPPEKAQGYAYVFSGDQLAAIPYFAVGLWGINFILDRRQQLKKPSYWSIKALAPPVFLMAFIGWGAAKVLLTFPRLLPANSTPLVALAAAANPLFEILIIISVTVIALFGLSQCLVHAIRLAGLMAESGFLNQEFRRISPQHQFPLYALLFFAGLMELSLFLVPIELLVTAVSGTLMIAIVLVHLPGIFSVKSPLPENRPFKLPLHPLFPAISTAIALALGFLPPFSNQFFLGFWLLVGIIYYFLYARRSAIAVRQAQAVVADVELPKKIFGNRVLCAVYDIEKSRIAVQTAVALARARVAELILLQVVVLPEQTTDGHRREVAQAVWQQLNEQTQILLADMGSIRPLVRLAPTVAEGILSTIWEEKVDTCVLGWPEEAVGREEFQDGVVDEVVQKARCEVLISRTAYPEKVGLILVPMMSDIHAPAALAVGQALAQYHNGKVVALSFVREAMTPERSAAAYDRIQEAVSKLKNTQGIEPLVEQTNNPKQLVIDSTQNYDLTLLGVSNEGFLAQTRFGGVPTEIALAAVKPVFLVKSHESASLFWFRRVWERLFDFFPTLTAKEQASVYLNMRRDARATIDFYVLIFLATAIAYFGLLQNSDAVIIGAMLVAPLMSPILALSQGIVQGNAKLMREAFQSTAKGAILAVAMATVATLLLFSIGGPTPATSAILARTSPGLLDLLVALVSGLAAAYATSRSSVAGALPGVAIAAALVPPLAVVGYGLGLAQFEYAGGALLLFLTNLAAIILAASIVFLLLGFRPPVRVERDEQTKFGLRVAAIALVAVTIPLLLTTWGTRLQAETDNTITMILDEYWLPNEALVGNIQIERDGRELIISFEVQDFTGNINSTDIAALQQEISTEINRTITLRSVITQANLDIVDDANAPILLTPTAGATAVPALPAETPSSSGTLTPQE